MQNLLDIPDITTLTASRSMLLNNILTALSQSSGTAFPTTNLQVGMPCFRTDTSKLYVLKDLTPTWTLIADLSADYSSQIVGRGILTAAIDFNAATYLVSGVWYINVAAWTGFTNHPASASPGGVLVVASLGGIPIQTYCQKSSATRWTRSYSGTAWSAWSILWTNANDGDGSGLDADLLDGYQSAQTATANTVAVRDANGKLAGDILGNAATATNATTAANATAIADGVVSTTAKLADGIVTLAKQAAMNTAKLIGRFTSGSGAPEEVGIGTGLALSAGNLVCTIVPRQLYPVGASVAANALTVTLDPCSLDFRSSTLTSGAVNSRTIASQISMTVVSGATLGTANATAAKLTLIAIDNAGTVELAIINNTNGSNTLDETGLISTTAMSATADVANTFYSTTARTNVPYRVVGSVTLTQATAGTWATAPSLVAGGGGETQQGQSSASVLDTVASLYLSKDVNVTLPVGVIIRVDDAIGTTANLSTLAGSNMAVYCGDNGSSPNSASLPGTWRNITGMLHQKAGGGYAGAGIWQRIA